VNHLLACDQAVKGLIKENQIHTQAKDDRKTKEKTARESFVAERWADQQSNAKRKSDLFYDDITSSRHNKAMVDARLQAKEEVLVAKTESQRREEKHRRAIKKEKLDRRLEAIRLAESASNEEKAGREAEKRLRKQSLLDALSLSREGVASEKASLKATADKKKEDVRRQKEADIVSRNLSHMESLGLRERAEARMRREKEAAREAKMSLTLGRLEQVNAARESHRKSIQEGHDERIRQLEGRQKRERVEAELMMARKELDVDKKRHQIERCKRLDAHRRRELSHTVQERSSRASALSSCMFHLERERGAALKAELIQKHQAEEALYKLQCTNFNKKGSGKAKRRRSRRSRGLLRPHSLPELQGGHYAAKDGMRVHNRRKIGDIAGRLGEVRPMGYADESYYEQHRDDASSPGSSPGRATAAYGGVRLTLPDI